MKKRHEMPEFEKWLDKKSYSQAEERVAEETWRTALRWVLYIDGWYDESGCVHTYINHPTREQIEKELNATSKERC